MKRSLKNFNEKAWNESLAKRDWSIRDDCENVNEMAKEFTDLITETLDEIARMKTFTVKSYYKFGLSAETKELMKKKTQSEMISTKQKSGKKWFYLININN